MIFIKRTIFCQYDADDKIKDTIWMLGCIDKQKKLCLSCTGKKINALKSTLDGKNVYIQDFQC